MAADGFEWMLGPLVTLGLGAGAIQVMKSSNRRAQLRLAEGELEYLLEAAPGATSEADQLPERPAF